MNIHREGQHCILRNFHINDITQRYIDWLNDPEVTKYLSVDGIQQTRESCVEYVRSYEGRDDKALIGLFTKEANPVHFGNITLLNIERKSQSAVFGIAIGIKEYRILAYEALQLFLAHCFDDFGLYRIEGGISETNNNSLSLLLHAGFKVEGRIRGKSIIRGKREDAYILGLLKDDAVSRELK